MRFSPKARRWTLISACTIVAALIPVWILRWSLLEAPVRAELKKLAADLFDADVKVGSLKGSLVTSIEAENVVLTPRAKSPFREFTIKRLEVGYGLFGKGTLDVRVSGARFEFAPSTSSRGPDAEEMLQTARDISRFRFPGRIQAIDSVVALPGGPEFHIEQGEIDYGTWRLTVSPVTIPVKGTSGVRLAKLEAELEPGRLSVLENADGGLIVAAGWTRDESHLEVHWGRGDGDYLAFKGRLEPELDAILTARLLKLDAPFVRELLTGLPLDGEADLEAALGGTPEAPTIDGQLQLIGLKVGEDSIDKLVFPLRAEPGALVLPRTTHQTPIGTVTLVEARFPFPWVKREAVVVAPPPPPAPKPPPPTPEPGPGPEVTAPLDKTPDLPPPSAAAEPAGPARPSDAPVITIELPNVEGFRNRLPAEIRPWIPLGRAQFTGMIGGEGWKVMGQFDGDRYEFPSPVGVLTDYEIEAELTATALVLTRFKGMLGGGPVEATGRVDLTTPNAPLVLDLKGTDLLVVTDDLARIRINPKVTITVKHDLDVTIEGRVDVPLALYYTEFGPAPEGGRRRDTSSPFGLRLLPAEGGGFRIPGIRDLDRVTLNVRVVSRGECRIENSMVGALIRADLNLRGSASSPGVSGIAWVEQGKGQVRLTSGLFLKINECIITLPSDPGHEATVRFEGSIGRFDQEILVFIAGPMARPTLRLQSNPPRSQEELLAMIAFGRTQGSLEGAGALGALTGKMISIYADSWPDPDYQESWMDRVRFGVRGEATERQVPPWELPTRGTSRGTMVRTEYLLNEYLSIVGETDREANLSGDLKLRVRFQ